MTKALKELKGHLEAKLANEIAAVKFANGELTVTVPAQHLIRTLMFLKDDPDCQFQSLVDVTAADYPERARRFDVVYHLLSYTHNFRVRLKVKTDEKSPVPSATEVYTSAGWYEREVWDMFGVLFTGHPDLRRILTDYGFQGHPLRKDFPLTGFVEVRYSEEQKRIVYEPVQLKQDFRAFDFMSPWEGAKYVQDEAEKRDDE